jgi:hypothetical protein
MLFNFATTLSIFAAATLSVSAHGALTQIIGANGITAAGFGTTAPWFAFLSAKIR